MPIKPNSIIPELIEQIFEKYTTIFDEQFEKEIFTKDSCAPLFIELDAIFGDVLKKALRLIDEQIITIYTNDKQLRNLAEITEGRRSQRVIKLLTDVNYCQCDFFTNNVLQIPLPLITEIPATSSTAPTQIIKKSSQSYTCQHILALRLAKLLRETKCLRQVNLPAHQFNFLLKQLNANIKITASVEHTNFTLK